MHKLQHAKHAKYEISNFGVWFVSVYRLSDYNYSQKLVAYRPVHIYDQYIKLCTKKFKPIVF